MSRRKKGKGEANKKLDIDRLLIAVERLKTVHGIRYHAINTGGEELVKRLLDRFSLEVKHVSAEQDFEHSLNKAIAIAIGWMAEPSRIVNSIVSTADAEIDELKAEIVELLS